MFRVKICGITSVEDALLAADAGADAIGLNFYEKSPRFVTVAVAHRIVGALPREIMSVFVFVNSPEDDIINQVRAAGFPARLAAQLHGDEPPEMVGHMQCMLGDALPIIRAFRCSSTSLDEVADYLRAIRTTK